jgi:hypothetical protein
MSSAARAAFDEGEAAVHRQRQEFFAHYDD